MKRTISKRTRILWLFIGGIGLPSLLLGYLAFRGVKNDQALIERDRIEEHRRFAGRIVQAVDQGIARAEQIFHDVLAGKDKDCSSGLVPRLQAFRKNSPLLDEVFVFRGPSEMDFPCAPLLYRIQIQAADSRDGTSGAVVSRSLGQGEVQEFQTNDLGQALLLYRRALGEAPDSRAKGEALIRIARVQRKSGSLSEALQTYRTISENYGQLRLGTGPPLGIAARLETGALTLELGHPSGALETLLGLYKELLNGRWLLDKGEFDFAVQRTKEAIGSILSQGSPPAEVTGSRDAFRALEGREKQERIRTERCLLFQSEAPRALEQRRSMFQDGTSQDPIRFNLDVGQTEFMVSLSPWRETRSGESEIWGLILTAKGLLDTLLLDDLRTVLSGTKTGWILKDKNGGILAQSSPPSTGTVTIEAGFKDNFPDWSIQFYQPDVRLPEALLTSRRGVFFAMFLLIAGILAFGWLLTLRAITHEVELSRLKSDFVSTVSHEFKSPLTSVRQIAEMLETGRVPSEERRQRYYEVLLEQSERLSLLTDNILSFARMEEGKREFKFDDVDVTAVLGDVVSSIRERVRHDGFEIALTIEESLPRVRADEEALSQVINNLLDNAVKYSGASRKVEIEAFAKDEHLVITVKDFGLGIPKEEQPRIFDRFFRGGNELTRTVKGSGLGLTLVKQIVRAHGGSIQVESEPGKGSLFTVSLPNLLKGGSS